MDTKIADLNQFRNRKLAPADADNKILTNVNGVLVDLTPSLGALELRARRAWAQRCRAEGVHQEPGIVDVNLLFGEVTLANINGILASYRITKMRGHSLTEDSGLRFVK